MADRTDFIDDDWGEFPTVSQDQWLRELTKGKPFSPVRREQEVDFSAVNTHQNLPRVEPESLRQVRSVSCVLEDRMEQPLNRNELEALLLAGVSGLRGRRENVAEVIRHLPLLPLRRLCLDIDDSSDEGLAPYLDYFRRVAHDSPLQGTIYLPTTTWEYWQQPEDKTTIDSIVELLTATIDVPTIRSVTIPSDAFHTLGAPVIDELAMTLSWLATYGDLLTDAGFSMELILARTEISLATGSDFFLDLAKFRAIRELVRKIAEAYGLAGSSEQNEPVIRAVSGTINKSLYDPDGNILRNTTEALSALLGGADVLALLPHDFLYPSSGEFGHRMARQVYNILRHEAQTERVYDPAAGSYFLEDITRQLVEKSWERFLAMEEDGGFLKLLRSGALVARCQQGAAEQVQRVNTQRKVVVGATRYVNQQETLGFTDGIATFRWAASFEKLRNALDRRVASGQARPKLHVWIQQDTSSAALISQRVHYVKDLLTSTGIAYEAFALNQPEDIDFSVPAEAHYLGVVFCGTDSFYTNVVSSILPAAGSSQQCQWIAGGSEAVEASVRQAGGNGVLGIGQDVVALIDQTINRWQHET